MKKTINKNEMKLERFLASFLENKNEQGKLSEVQSQQREEGKKLRALREKINISRNELSDKMKISTTLIQKIEAGDYVDSRKGIYVSSLFAMKFILEERLNALQDFMDSMIYA